VPGAAGGAPQRQVWLSPAGSMADGRGNGDPAGVEVLGAGVDEITPPGGGSSVDDRHTSAGTTDAGARRERTLLQPLPPTLDPTGTRPPTGAPSGTTHPEAVLSGAGSHFGVGQMPDVTTWGGGSGHHRHGNLRMGALVVLPYVPGVPRVPRRLITALKPTVSVPRPSGAVGDPLLVLKRGRRCQDRHESLQAGALVVLSQAHGVPGMARVSSCETPWPRSFGLKLPDC